MENFAPLAEIPGVRLISLQPGGRSSPEAACSTPPWLCSLGPEHDRDAPFLDTAAVMKHLDLVLTCDSVIAHLAGALAVPVWLALPLAHEWRWFSGRDDSPWYPSMRLFRQSSPGDWAGVLTKSQRRCAARGQPLQRGKKSWRTPAFGHSERSEESGLHQGRRRSFAPLRMTMPLPGGCQKIWPHTAA